MHRLPQPAVTSEALVLIVSTDAREREQLRRHLPPGVVVHCAATEDEAFAMLRAVTESPTIGTDGATASGVHLVPDGVLVAGTLVRLTPLEHAMLRCLLSPSGSVWSFRALSEQVWGTAFVGDGSQVRAVLKRLRRKLLAAGTDLQIESVRGRGLRLVVGPQRASECPTTAPVSP